MATTAPTPKKEKVYVNSPPPSRSLAYIKEVASHGAGDQSAHDFIPTNGDVLAPVWLIPSPCGDKKQGTYIAMKNENTGDWHQVGDIPEEGSEAGGSGDEML